MSLRLRITLSVSDVEITCKLKSAWYFFHRKGLPSIASGIAAEVDGKYIEKMLTALMEKIGDRNLEEEIQERLFGERSSKRMLVKEIRCCSECEIYSRMGEYCCRKLDDDKSLRHVEDRYTIPDWCPLPETDERINK